MLITKKIKLKDKNYYIKIDCAYKNKDGHTYLCLKDYKDDYYDGGDLSILIERLEENYDTNKISKQYKSDVFYIIDCVYIYDNIPFISGVGDMYISPKDDCIATMSYITKEELDDYIKDNNIPMKDNSKFCLADGRTWNI